MTGDLSVHHIGYAVESIEQAFDSFYAPCFGISTRPIVIEDPVQRVRVAFITLPGGTIELVEPTSTTSPVWRLVSERRGGIYHVAYSTANIENALALFAKTGSRIVSGPAPAAAFRGRRIAFIITPPGDLIEFVEAS